VVQELHAQLLLEEAVGLELGSLSMLHGLVAQAAALSKHVAEAGEREEEKKEGEKVEECLARRSKSRRRRRARRRTSSSRSRRSRRSGSPWTSSLECSTLGPAWGAQNSVWVWERCGVTMLMYALHACSFIILSLEGT
jgi:hypothetical protein